MSSNNYNKNDKSEELGKHPINQMLLKYSLPAIIASTAASLYNVIDRIFIGQGVGPLAISGLAITLPIMNLAIAFENETLSDDDFRKMLTENNDKKDIKRLSMLVRKLKNEL